MEEANNDLEKLKEIINGTQEYENLKVLFDEVFCRGEENRLRLYTETYHKYLKSNHIQVKI